MKNLFSNINSCVLPIILICISFNSCSHKPGSVPSDIIPKDKMADVLVDVQLAEASADNRGLNTPQLNMLVAAKYDSLFRKHGITFEQFKSSYDYYLNHADELSEIYGEVVNKLTTMESKAASSRKIKPPRVYPKDTLPHH